MKRVLIVDDHAIVREGVKNILAKMGEFEIPDEASTGWEAIASVSKNDYDIVLLDIGLPDKSGLEVLEEIKIRKPEMPVLILTMHAEKQYAVRVLRAGASGYMTKNTLPELLAEAVRKILNGDQYLPQGVAEQLRLEVGKDATRPLHTSLSDREFQILIRIAKGLSLKEIAGELNISDKTVSTYRTRIQEKMNMNANAELIRYVVENGLLD